MVDATQAMESEFINVDLVREALQKKLVILDEGKYEPKEFNGKKYEALSLTVSLEGKKKIWSPNMDTVKNIASCFGRDTKTWVGQVIGLQIVKKNGKDSILGIPLMQEAKKSP